MVGLQCVVEAVRDWHTEAQQVNNNVEKLEEKRLCNNTRNMDSK